jgi:two-component system chemotaxis response regulator CheB
LRNVDVDHVCRIDDMARLLARLARQPAGPTPDIPLDIRLEAAIAAQELADMRVNDMLGTPSRFTCPECHGALWEIEDESMLRFRCHVGHAFTADTVLASQGEEIDRLLGTLLRSHQERAALTQRMAERERANDRRALAEHLEKRARDYEHDVEIMRKLLRSGEAGSGGTPDQAEGSVAEYEDQNR